MHLSNEIGPFSIVPEWVLNRELSATALKMYIVLARFADWKTGRAFPARDTLAERMRCSEKTVDRAIAELVEAECIEKRSRGRYASAVYRVLQIDPRQTELSTLETYLSDEQTDLSEREDKNDHLTITNEREPLEQKLNNYLETKKSNARNHRLPEDWYPSDRLLAMFANKWPGVDRDFEIDQFINYWHAEGKTKADWDRAFQVWMNRAEQRSKPRTQQRKLTNAEQGALLVQQLRAKREQKEALEARKMIELEVGSND
jgi:DNA-binding transcriptional regulator YhcF (GntR family)